MEELLKAVRHGKTWVDSFTRFDYRDAFHRYCTQFEPAYMAAVQAYSSVEKLAEELIDAMEADWKKEHFWNRSAAKVDDKMVLVVYLTPMLLASREERCHELAKALCAAWGKKFPENGYGIADYEELADGFRNTIMGFDLAGKHMKKRD